MWNLQKSIEKRIKIISLHSPEISTPNVFCECPSLNAFYFIVSLVLHRQFHSLVVVWCFFFFSPTSFINFEVIPKVSFNEFIRVKHVVGKMSSESAD